MKNIFSFLFMPLLISAKIIFTIREKGYRVHPKYKDRFPLHEIGTIKFGRN